MIKFCEVMSGLEVGHPAIVRLDKCHTIQTLPVTAIGVSSFVTVGGTAYVQRKDA